MLHSLDHPVARCSDEFRLKSIFRATYSNISWVTVAYNSIGNVAAKVEGPQLSKKAE